MLQKLEYIGSHLMGTWLVSRLYLYLLLCLLYISHPPSYFSSHFFSSFFSTISPIASPSHLFSLGELFGLIFKRSKPIKQFFIFSFFCIFVVFVRRCSRIHLKTDSLIDVFHMINCIFSFYPVSLLCLC